jgi:hypothetical protein
MISRQGLGIRAAGRRMHMGWNSAFETIALPLFRGRGILQASGRNMVINSSAAQEKRRKAELVPRIFALAHSGPLQKSPERFRFVMPRVTAGHSPGVGRATTPS